MFIASSLSRVNDECCYKQLLEIASKKAENILIIAVSHSSVY